ncbi:MAG: HD domain-containing phosphohydrolase [Rhodospirillaceae bacterium]|jgi:HD-GYP domain-containing protein (c-di-GMP phosphodiesterase class II)
MPADETQSQKSSIYIFGGFPKYREEVETTLKSFYELKFFEDLERAGEDVFKVAPKAIMVDEIVPPKGGANLIARIRKIKEAKSIPIIFSVKATSKEMVAEAKSYGGIIVLEKPYRKSTLVNALSDGVNKSVEAEWEQFDPVQKAALKNSLSSFNSIADLIHAGEPIPYDDVRDSCAPLTEAVQSGNYKDILAGVSNHDNYTYVHSLRVATFLSLFGNTLGIGGDDLKTLATGGLLHDAGKMFIPHNVLNKAGKLTDEEFAVMKSHVCCTVDFLEKTPDIPNAVLVIAGQHHEKLDGSGYPHGIKGLKLN